MSDRPARCDATVTIQQGVFHCARPPHDDPEHEADTSARCNEPGQPGMGFEKTAEVTLVWRAAPDPSPETGRSDREDMTVSDRALNGRMRSVHRALAVAGFPRSRWTDGRWSRGYLAEVIGPSALVHWLGADRDARIAQCEQALTEAGFMVAHVTNGAGDDALSLTL